MSESRPLIVHRVGSGADRVDPVRWSAQTRLLLAMELSSPSLLVQTLELVEHWDGYVVPSAVGFFVPRSLPEAVASARTGHARWLELELTVYRKGWHRAAPGDEERGG